jgi:hypothetical protein
MARRVFLLATFVATLLVFFGWWRFRDVLPRSSATALLAATTVLLVYAAVGYAGVPVAARRHPEAMRLGSCFGLLLSGMLGLQIVTEYLVPVTPRLDGLLGRVTFGSLPPLCFAVGATAAFRTRRWRDSIVAPTWGMLIGSAVWVVVLLVTYYSFLGTPQERRLFDAENVWEDYRRSGESGLRAFLMVDYCGACCFHLTLGPAMGAICGGTGGVITLTAVTLWCRRRRT